MTSQSKLWWRGFDLACWQSGVLFLLPKELSTDARFYFCDVHDWLFRCGGCIRVGL